MHCLRREGLVCALTLLVGVGAHAAEPGGAPQATDQSTRVDLVWFGRTGGVSNHVGRNRAHLELYERVGAELTSIHPLDEGPRAFVSGERIAFRPGGLTVADFTAFLASGPHTRQVLVERFSVASSPFEAVIELPPVETGFSDPTPVPTADALSTPVLDLFFGDDAVLPGIERRSMQLVRYLSIEGQTLTVIEPPPPPPVTPRRGRRAAPPPAPTIEPPPLPLDPLEWETRFVSEGRVTTADGHIRRVINVGRPLHDGARRLRWIIERRAQATHPLLVLAAGDDVEGFSFTGIGTPDRQRANTWTAFRRMGLSALVPGAAELAFGIDPLAREAQQSEVPVLTANVAETPFAGWRLIEAGPAQVLVVGLVDPALPASARARSFGARAIGDPAAAVEAAVDQARARLGRHPDLVVALGVLSPPTRAALEQTSGVVDLLLADFQDHGLHALDQSSRLPDAAARLAHRRARHPIPVAPAGSTRLGWASVELVPAAAEAGGPRWRLARVSSRAVPITGDQPADPQMARSVARTRQAVYADHQTRLLPDLGPGIIADPVLRARFEQSATVRRMARSGQAVPGRVTPELWRDLVARGVAERLDAEVAILPPLAMPWGLIGPVSALQAAANLAGPHHLRLAWVDAAALETLRAHPAINGQVIVGLDRAKGLVRGRPIDPRERYRVAYADGLAADPELAALLGTRPRRRFSRGEGGVWRPDPEGAPLPLRDLALDALATRSEAAGVEGVLDWMRPVGAEKRARWILDLRALSFEGSAYSVLGAGADEAYSEVRDTRVTTASHRMLAARGDVFLNREGVDFDWSNRLRIAFAKAYYDDSDDKETEDILQLTSEVRAPPWALRIIDAVPFANLAGGTEFTPTEDNPRKMLLEGAVGLSWSGEVVRSTKAGWVVAHDFSAGVPDPQVGLLAATDLRLELPGSVWYAELEGRYYFPGIGVDNATELSMLLKGRTGLDVPLIDRLALGLFVDLFAYRGQVPRTRDPGASLIAGVALKYDRRFKPSLW